MAVTIAVRSEANRGRNVAGRDREVFADITGPASYTTGGEALTLAQLKALCPGLGTAIADWSKVKFFLSEVDSSGRYVSLDKTNRKIMFWDADSEIANATNLSSVSIRVFVRYNA